MDTAPPDDSDVLLPDALAEVVRHLEKYTEPFLPSPVVVEVSEGSKAQGGRPAKHTADASISFAVATTISRVPESRWSGVTSRGEIF